MENFLKSMTLKTYFSYNPNIDLVQRKIPLAINTRHPRKIMQETQIKLCYLHCCIRKKSYDQSRQHLFFGGEREFNFIFFTLQYCIGFGHTLTWIHHRCTWVHNPEPPSHHPPHIISLGNPSDVSSENKILH